MRAAPPSVFDVPFPAPPVPTDLEATVRAALAEDLGSGDLTTETLVPAGKTVRATLWLREDAVIAGIPWFEAGFRLLDSSLRIGWKVGEGDRVRADTLLAEIEGPARPVLGAERTALNFLQLLSGTATATRRYVESVAGTSCRILDTRKTLPGLRSAQKYATRIGGATNHRFGLYDAILIKENHLASVGGLPAALEKTRGHAGVPVILEVESLVELEEALALGAAWILLDNFPLDDIREAVRLTAGRARLEASGGMDLDTVRAVAACGVDFISVGALTKHVRAVDLSLRILGD
jgi:nicotinate-nucleotide pyrophosphorylase (carboxylating)